MDKYDVRDLAAESGISDSYFDFQMVSPDDLLKFARLVATKERERIVELLEELERHLKGNATPTLSELVLIIRSQENSND